MTTSLWFLNEIQDAVRSPESADPDLLREAIVAYSEACGDVNSRLRDVGRLLRQGLRLEAIEIAETEPSLLERFTELDFSGRADWYALLARWNMAAPPQLESELAAQLNTAYAEMMPLEQSLRRHRLLALARAPLWSRIENLRTIVQLDPLSPVWTEDLQRYERARLREIRNEIHEAERGADRTRIESLHDEVLQSRWSIEVPPEIKNAIRAVACQVATSAAHASLAELLPQLEAAYSQFDVPRGIALAKQWRAAAKEANLDNADPLANQAADALAWVSDQQQKQSVAAKFEADCDHLNQALRSKAPAAEIEALWAALGRYELQPPEGLQARYERRLATFHSRERHRRLLVSSLAALLTMAGIIGVVVYVVDARRDAELLTHAKQLEQYVTRSQWIEGQSYLSKLPPTAANSPQLMSLAEQITKAATEEGQRATRLKELLNRLSGQPAVEVSDPDLTLAKTLARSREELAECEAIVARVEGARLDRQAQQDAELTQSIERHSPASGKPADLSPDGEADTRRHYNELDQDVKRLAFISPNKRAEADETLRQLNELLTRQQKANADVNARPVVFAKIGILDDYAKALKEFAKAHQGTDGAEDAEQVVQNQAAWGAIHKWSEFWRDSPSDLSGLSPQEAKRLLDAGRELMSAEPAPCFLAADFRSREKLLETIARRPDVDISRLKSTLLTNPICVDASLVVDDEGIRYYCPNPPVERSEFLQFAYFTDFSTKTNISRRLSSIRYKGDAPQAKVVRTASEWLPKCEQRWDEAFCRMLWSIQSELVGDPSLDDVLAVELVRNVLTPACEGSQILRDAYAGLLQEIESEDIDTSVYWFAPSDPDAERERDRARLVLKPLRDIAGLKQRYIDAKRESKAVNNRPFATLRWVAVLKKAPNGEWRCEPQLPLSAQGDLCVATQSLAEESSLFPIGTVDAGQVRWLNDQELSQQRIFEPLFLYQRSDSR